MTVALASLSHILMLNVLETALKYVKRFHNLGLTLNQMEMCYFMGISHPFSTALGLAGDKHVCRMARLCGLTVQYRDILFIFSKAEC